MGRQGHPGLLPLLTAVFLSACSPSPSEVDPASRFAPSAEAASRSLGVYSGGQRVGDMAFSRRDGVWGGAPAVEFGEEVTLRLSFRGDRFEVRSRSRAWIDPDERLLGSESAVDFGGGSWETRWQRTGEGAYLKSESLGGRPSVTRSSIPADLVPAEALPLVMERMASAAGTRLSFEVYSTAVGRSLPVTLVYRGSSVGVRRFTLQMWGMTEEVDLDIKGLPVRETLSLAGVEARSGTVQGVVGNLALEKVLSQTAVPAHGVPRDLALRSDAILAIQGVDQAPPSTPWQTVTKDGDRTVLRLSAPRVPDDRSGSAPPPADDLALDLDSPRIRELAATVTQGLTDPWEKAAAVGRWVHDNLGKSMRECFSALQALEAREGECQSHSLLTVSLIRSAGVNARFAYGVVYMPDRDAFLYHTWVEAFAGEWIPLDPTLGSFPTGPDRITLATGGYRDQFSVLPYLLGGRGGWAVSWVGDR